MNKLDTLKAQASNLLEQDREGAEIFEYVLIVALLVALIIVLFRVVGPVFQAKMNEIANDVSTSGADMIGLSNGIR
jgi:Flp pilus assembly pilin Flp